jgi:hypothetical protein
MSTQTQAEAQAGSLRTPTRSGTRSSANNLNIDGNITTSIQQPGKPIKVNEEGFRLRGKGHPSSTRIHSDQSKSDQLAKPRPKGSVLKNNEVNGSIPHTTTNLSSRNDGEYHVDSSSQRNGSSRRIGIGAGVDKPVQVQARTEGIKSSDGAGSSEVIPLGLYRLRFLN